MHYSPEQIRKALRGVLNGHDKAGISGQRPMSMFRISNLLWCFYDQLDATFETANTWAHGLFVQRSVLEQCSEFVPNFLYLYQDTNGKFLGRIFRTNAEELRKLSTNKSINNFRKQEGWYFSMDKWDPYFVSPDVNTLAEIDESDDNQ